jgi:LysR family transcriptional regulator, nitrogen assimilation regulatory protein
MTAYPRLVEVDTKKLRFFVKIVELGSLTRAADALHIAQSALSQQLVALEREVGARLLSRSSRGVAVTPAGKTLYRYGQLILRQYQQAIAEIKSTGELLRGDVSIGFTTGTASMVSLPLLADVRSQFPGITLCLHEGLSGSVIEMLMNNRLDMAMLYCDRPLKGVNCKPLLVETLYLVSKIDQSGQGEETVPVSSLSDRPLILPSRSHALRSQVDAAFSECGIAPHVIAEVDSLNTIVGAAEQGIAAAILPRSVVRDRAAAFKVQRLVDPEVTRTIALCVPQSVGMSTTIEVVYANLIRVVDRLLASDAWPGVRRVVA